MPDLKDQIRAYYEATTEPVDVHDVVVDTGTVLVGPFPDAAQRRAGMDAKTDKSAHGQRHGQPSGWARGWLIAGGIAAVSLLIVATALVVRGTDADVAVPSSAPASTALSDSTTTATSPTSPVDVVEASYAAFNLGDLDSWLAYYASDAVVSGIRLADVADQYAPLFSASAERVVDSCVPGEPNRDGLATVECVHVETNDFHSPGGFAITMSMTYVVDDDGFIAFSSLANSEYQALTRYNTLFWLWLEENHPEAYAEIQPNLELRGDDPGTGSRYPPTPESMQRVLPLVPDFVAQSDSYPLAP